MEVNEIMSHVDHTLLSQIATKDDIRRICREGMKYNCASVCIPPSYVKFAKKYIEDNDDSLPVCTVIGFPNGYMTTAAKVFETEDAIANGADEIDMVVNIGWIKDKRWEDISKEICAVKQSCQDKILKVIIETCLLTDDEKKEMCSIVANAGADYIKTSTGFASGGATFEDVQLMVDNTGSIKVKAAGGISSFDDAEKFLEIGADRLGTSRLVKILETK